MPSSLIESLRATLSRWLHSKELAKWKMLAQDRGAEARWTKRLREAEQRYSADIWRTHQEKTTFLRERNEARDALRAMEDRLGEAQETLDAAEIENRRLARHPNIHTR